MFWSVLSASFEPLVLMSQSRAHTLLILVANVMKCSFLSCSYVIGGQVMLHTTKLQAYTGWAFSHCSPSTRQQWQRCNSNVTICCSQWNRINSLPNQVWRKYHREFEAKVNLVWRHAGDCRKPSRCQILSSLHNSVRNCILQKLVQHWKVFGDACNCSSYILLSFFFFFSSVKRYNNRDDEYFPICVFCRLYFEVSFDRLYFSYRWHFSHSSRNHA